MTELKEASENGTGTTRDDSVFEHGGEELHNDESLRQGNAQRGQHDSTFTTTTANNNNTNKTVQALFGTAVGPSWGDFYCTHNRIQGRLYASAHAALFYSNFLGFETRVTLYWKDILELSLVRTTSIRIVMRDSEEYVFRSFVDRRAALQLLRALAAPPRAWSVRSVNAITTNSNDHEDANNYTKNRQRAVSDSNIDALGVSRDGFTSSLTSGCDELPDDESSLNSYDVRAEIEEEWKKEKDVVLSTVGISPLTLLCSLETFFLKFFADDASHSIVRFHREECGDRDVQVTDWDVDADGIFTRNLTFIHPLNNSLGPSEARTTRKQRLKRYEELGIILENETFVEGVPSADAFYVKDHWLIEASGPAQVTVQQSFESTFTKRAMFRGIIERTIKKETELWMASYAKMLTNALEDSAISDESDKPADTTANVTNTRALVDHLQMIILKLNRLETCVIVWMFAVTCIIILQQWTTRHTLILLGEELSKLQQSITSLSPLVQLCGTNQPNSLAEMSDLVLETTTR